MRYRRVGFSSLLRTLSMIRRNFEGSGIKLPKTMISIPTSLRDCSMYCVKSMRRDFARLLISKGFMV
jgi:hypothetical protein